ncbi:hypothetical protein T265_02421 [Opisthorchis viverrini]|uniref:Uncharacterized protein n=1 Tax=Opisthorchis viverrini TaxID=6198 RepID=A0A074ZW69_OPIVI|nr:hypothetical protein T265_02421 [Opisthorchis viverrini]KER31376.1 hypothetical protein T265_02421 [Opisthorchis viverrini]
MGGLNMNQLGSNVPSPAFHALNQRDHYLACDVECVRRDHASRWRLDAATTKKPNHTCID